MGQGANEIAKSLGVGSDAESITDKTLEEIVGKDADAALAKFNSAKRNIEAFKAQLAKLVELEDRKKPLFILVDELDRCRPIYAIALLERVKHLFETDDVVFVIATDTGQLRHAVGSVYGAGFDGAGYLLRFFDRTYRFATPSTRDYIVYLFAIYEIPAALLSSPLDNKHAEFFSKIAELFGMSLREIERCFDLLRSVVTNWQSSDRLKIELILLLPLIVFYCRNEMEKFYRLSKMTPTDFQTAGPPSIEYRYRSGRDVNDGTIGVAQLIQEFVNLARTPLPEIKQSGSERPPEAWMRERMREEFAVLHANRWSESPGPRSICAHYGELVRSVGRLTVDRE